MTAVLSSLLLSTSTSTSTCATCGERRNHGSINTNNYHTTICYCYIGVTNRINPTINVYTGNIRNYKHLMSI